MDCGQRGSVLFACGDRHAIDGADHGAGEHGRHVCGFSDAQYVRWGRHCVQDSCCPELDRRTQTLRSHRLIMQLKPGTTLGPCSVTATFVAAAGVKPITLHGPSAHMCNIAAGGRFTTPRGSEAALPQEGPDDVELLCSRPAGSATGRGKAVGLATLPSVSTFSEFGGRMVNKQWTWIDKHSGLQVVMSCGAEGGIRTPTMLPPPGSRGFGGDDSGVIPRYERLSASTSWDSSH